MLIHRLISAVKFGTVPRAGEVYRGRSRPQNKGRGIKDPEFFWDFLHTLTTFFVEPPNLERKAELERERFSRVDNHDHIRDPMEYESWNFSAVVESMHCPESSSK